MRTAIGLVTTDVAESANVTALAAKTSYRYRLSVTTNAGTVVGDVEEFTTLPQAPAVVTEGASGVTQTSATIAGTVNPHGGAAGCKLNTAPAPRMGASPNARAPREPGKRR